ncbi:MAG: Holliday junction resolvase RuvX [Bacteroidales bacterium]|nr:MAG: Holliday junction resolvase RuvX [Bacteroidales bacterium]
MSGRIMGIDYGRKRVGLAVTDPSGIIAGGLKTVPATEIWTFLDEYLEREKVVRIVVGYPKKMNTRPSGAADFILPFVRKLQEKFREIPVDMMDERYTSRMAVQTMVEGGLKKKKRQDKSLVDTVSATLILQSYLDRLNVENRKL